MKRHRRQWQRERSDWFRPQRTEQANCPDPPENPRLDWPHTSQTREPVQAANPDRQLQTAPTFCQYESDPCYVRELLQGATLYLRNVHTAAVRPSRGP